jgi:hypothetical protein
MAVTNANAGVDIGNTSVSSLTLTAFNATGSDFIFLGVSQWSLTDRTPSATFNAVQNFTVHAQQTMVDGSGTRRVTVLKLVAPTLTSANLVVSWSGTVDEAVIGATAWLGVDQTTPLGTAVLNTVAGAINLSVSVTAAVGGITHDCFSGSADTQKLATTNQTQRWHDWAAISTTEAGGASAAGTGGSVTHTWSDVGHGGAPSNVNIVLIGVPINASSGSAPPSMWSASVM